MEPMVPNQTNRALAGAAGFATGIIAQLILMAIVDSVVGPITNITSPKMLLWVIILLTPPVLSYMFLEVAPGSIREYFLRAVQMGALFWFLWLVVARFLV